MEPKDEKIPIDEIKNSIINSGYLIEQRVEAIMEQNEFDVETNVSYFDSDTNKSREIDLLAASYIGMTDDLLTTYLLIECENNKQPIVFFKSNSSIGLLAEYDIKISGYPTYFFEPDGTLTFIQEKLRFSRFHHYCNYSHCTQYCSFQYVKNANQGNTKRWIALHPDEQHNTFSGLIKCLKAKINDEIKNYSLPEKKEKESINLQIYYPVVILQGDLYEAELNNNELSLNKTNHVVFKMHSATHKDSETYFIDVINESFLVEYLKLVNNETKKIRDKIRRKKNLFYESLDILVSELRKAKNPKEFHEILIGEDI